MDVEKAIKRRYNRAAVSKSRNGENSYIRMYEDALIMLAWEAGELSEGQVVVALEADRIDQRQKRIDAIRMGAELGGALHERNRGKIERRMQQTSTAP